ncbi:MAG: UDP-3-O-(3-hydroxymyristoyl)glucosamine N-acyltransferase [Desulfobacteraceae bacterium]|nr:MAG: UDP-3-O-(3-hydroxymyristoyl)glucosamine N-acyltransferase [Desulfobacteraceae bacterium]
MEYTLQQIARVVDGRVTGDSELVITGMGALSTAQPGQISFYGDPRYLKDLTETHASALIVADLTDLFKGPQILVANPQLAFAKVVALFAPSPSGFTGISSQAFIHATARIGANPTVFPWAYIGENARIGNDVVLFPGVFIGDRAQIGDRTVLHPNVVVLHDCLLGNDVCVHGGTVIGSDGFGFTRQGSAHVKIPQVGMVQIDDQVEIGANCTIDRAALGKTWIKRGVKTDNQVHIAHNVVIGENSIIVAQVGISGSVQLGREVVIAGQAGIKDHVAIGDRVIIGSRAGITASVPADQIVSGFPAMPHRLWLKTRGLIERLPDLQARIKMLEKKILDLEQQRLDKE